jgi:hypothetical protein
MKALPISNCRLPIVKKPQPDKSAIGNRQLEMN